MWTRHAPTLTVFLALLGLSAQAMAARCYRCRSDLQENCGAGVGAEHLVECDGADACRKMVQRLDFLDADVTIRECALVERGERCYRRVWPGEAVVTSCDCYGEGCNGADRPRWTGRLAATAAVLVNLFPP